MEFKALTCIDMISNLVEIIRIRNKTSRHVAEQFANCWLSRYPRPNKCIFDRGGEFIGPEFQSLLDQAGIKPKPTTVKNPEANSVCERMHDTIGSILRVTTRTDPPANQAEAEQAVDNAIHGCIHATRCAINLSLIHI